jgi:hypothetical protein
MHNNKGFLDMVKSLSRGTRLPQLFDRALQRLTALEHVRPQVTGLGDD